jgi:hypothetical protein
MTPNLKVSRDFTKYSDAGLDEFANGVVAGLTGNATFPSPPVKPEDLAKLDVTFRDAIAAATGDPQDTLAKKTARDALLDGLRQDANYVQTVASHNLQQLLSSGYYAASNNHVQTSLDPPLIQNLENLVTTKFLLRLTPVLNAKAYHVQTNTNGNGTWTEAGIYTQARRIELGNLTPGTVYNVRARAIGGSTGCSDWCKPNSLMAT